MTVARDEIETTFSDGPSIARGRTRLVGIIILVILIEVYIFWNVIIQPMTWEKISSYLLSGVISLGIFVICHFCGCKPYENSQRRPERDQTIFTDEIVL